MVVGVGVGDASSFTVKCLAGCLLPHGWLAEGRRGDTVAGGKCVTLWNTGLKRQLVKNCREKEECKRGNWNHDRASEKSKGRESAKVNVK